MFFPSGTSLRAILLWEGRIKRGRNTNECLHRGQTPQEGGTEVTARGTFPQAATQVEGAGWRTLPQTKNLNRACSLSVQVAQAAPLHISRLPRTVDPWCLGRDHAVSFLVYVQSPDIFSLNTSPHA